MENKKIKLVFETKEDYKRRIFKTHTKEEIEDFIQQYGEDEQAENFVKILEEILKEKLPVVMVNALLEYNKMGINDDILQFLQERGITIKYNIEDIGFNLSIPERRAFFAIQQALYKTTFQGNLKSQSIYDPFNINGLHGETLIRLRLSGDEFYYLCGQKKITGIDGYKRFDSRECETNSRALKGLSGKTFNLIELQKGGKYLKQSQILFVIAKATEWGKINGNWYIKADEEFTFDLYPAFHKTNNFFILKDPTIYSQIKELHPHASIYEYNFMEYLNTQGGLKIRQKSIGNLTNWTIEIGYLNLAEKLRMNLQIKKSRKKQISKIFKKCFKLAMEMKYLTDYPKIRKSKVNSEIDIIILNLNKDFFADRLKTLVEIKFPIQQSLPF